MAIRQKTQVTMQMAGSAVSHARTDISVRDIAAVIDEPEARGGTNQGMTPTETMLASLLGCTNVISQRLAHREGVRFEEMRMEARASFDRRGAGLEAEVDVPFPRIELDITLRTDADAAVLERIKADLGRYCPIAKVLRGAGTEIVETWTVQAL